MSKRNYWPQVIGILLVYLIACAIEPCDGHGCDKQQVTYAR
jgi:hypothetical protein